MRAYHTKKDLYTFDIFTPPPKKNYFLHILDDFKKKTNQFSQISKMWTNREICYKNLYTFISHSIFDAKASKFIKQGVQKLLPSHSHINTIKFLT